MKKTLFLLTFGLVTASIAAQGVDNRLNTKINTESESHQQRIGILEKADECIHNASTKEEYQLCEQAEKDARKAMKETRKAARAENFAEHKAEVLKRLEERQNVNTTAKACVEAATTIEEMKKCRPARPEGIQKGEGHRKEFKGQNKN